MDWKPDGPHMLITQLVEGKPTRKRFYGVEAKNKYLETIAYFKNEEDRDLFLAAPDLLAACEGLLESAVVLIGDEGFYECHHCGGTAYGGPSGIRHDNACATTKAIAAIARVKGES